MLGNINKISEYVATTFFVRVPSIGEVILVCVLNVFCYALIRGERDSECGSCTKVTPRAAQPLLETHWLDHDEYVWRSASLWVTLLKQTHIASWVCLLTSLNQGRDMEGTFLECWLQHSETNLLVTGWRLQYRNTLAGRNM